MKITNQRVVAVSRNFNIKDATIGHNENNHYCQYFLLYGGDVNLNSPDSFRSLLTVDRPKENNKIVEFEIDGNTMWGNYHEMQQVLPILEKSQKGKFGVVGYKPNKNSYEVEIIGAYEETDNIPKE